MSDYADDFAPPDTQINSAERPGPFIATSATRAEMGRVLLDRRRSGRRRWVGEGHTLE